MIHNIYFFFRRLNARGVAAKRGQPDRRDRTLALMNTACAPQSINRKIAYLPNLRRKSEQSSDGAQGDVSLIGLGQ